VVDLEYILIKFNLIQTKTKKKHEYLSHGNA